MFTTFLILVFATLRKINTIIVAGQQCRHHIRACVQLRRRGAGHSGGSTRHRGALVHWPAGVWRGVRQRQATSPAGPQEQGHALHRGHPQHLLGQPWRRAQTWGEVCQHLSCLMFTFVYQKFQQCWLRTAVK